MYLVKAKKKNEIFRSVQTEVALKSMRNLEAPTTDIYIYMKIWTKYQNTNKGWWFDI